MAFHHSRNHFRLLEAEDTDSLVVAHLVLDDVPEPSQAATDENLRVEGVVQLQEMQIGVLVRRPALLLDEEAHLGKRALIRFLAEATHRLLLQGGPEQALHLHLGQVYQADACAALRPDIHQALAFELLQGIADRALGDQQAVDQLLQLQLGAGGKLQGEDIPLQLLIDLVATGETHRLLFSIASHRPQM